MSSQPESVAILYNNLSVLEIRAEEILHHGIGFFGRNNFGVFKILHEISDVGRMIRLHMMDNQIVGLPSAQLFFNVDQPLTAEIHIHCIHNSDFLVKNHVGIISNAIRNFVLTFKKVNLMIIDTDILDIFCNVHI